MSRRELLAQVTETTESLHAAQAAHWHALLDARDDGATLEQLGKAIGIPRMTVRWRVRAALRETGRPDLRAGKVEDGTQLDR